MNEGHSSAWDQEWGKAAVAYRMALQEMPDNPKALNSLGLALFQQGNYEEALHIYKRAAQVSHQDPSPMEKLAQLLERTGHLNEAIAAAAKAAELFLNQRDVDKAIENWVRVTMLDPENVMAHSRLALAHERLGHKARAVTEYIAVASLVQRTGNIQKTAELVNKALQLIPERVWGDTPASLAGFPGEDPAGRRSGPARTAGTTEETIMQRAWRRSGIITITHAPGFLLSAVRNVLSASSTSVSVVPSRS